MADRRKVSYGDTFSSPYHTIGVSGIIGAGKSSFARALGKLRGYDIHHEPVETNPYLEKFYQDKAKYGAMMQIFLLSERFNQHQNIIWSRKNAIQDRTIYEDVIFAKMLYESGDIEELDFQTYRNLFASMSNFLHRPDVIIYLDVEPDVALYRVSKRGRECESSIPLEYLQSLKEGYEEWIQDVDPRIPIIRIDWNKDLSGQEYTKMVEEVDRKIRGELQRRKGLTL